MTILDRLAPALERERLRRMGGDRVDAGRRCSDCRRIPLIGERIYLYEGGHLACELCQPLRKRKPMGSELVRGPAYDQVIRLTRESG
jgi:hypothetical protein